MLDSLLGFLLMLAHAAVSQRFYDLPGHGVAAAVHAWVSVEEPGQSKPKLAGTGLSQGRSLVIVPD